MIIQRCTWNEASRNTLDRGARRPRTRCKALGGGRAQGAHRSPCPVLGSMQLFRLFPGCILYNKLVRKETVLLSSVSRDTKPSNPKGRLGECLTASQSVRGKQALECATGVRSRRSLWAGAPSPQSWMPTPGGAKRELLDAQPEKQVGWGSALARVRRAQLRGSQQASPLLSAILTLHEWADPGHPPSEQGHSSG